jgi:hypothetical protein
MDISRFASFSRATYVERVKELIGYEDGARSLDIAVAEGFCSSLQRLAPLCRSVPELEYLARMKKIATYASTDPAESEEELLPCSSGDRTLTTARLPSTLLHFRQAGKPVPSRLQESGRSQQPCVISDYPTYSYTGLRHDAKRGRGRSQRAVIRRHP